MTGRPAATAVSTPAAAPEKDKRKQSFYVPFKILHWLTRESLRQERSMSWLVQRALKIARREIEALPSADGEAGVVADYVDFD